MKPQKASESLCWLFAGCFLGSLLLLCVYAPQWTSLLEEIRGEEGHLLHQKVHLSNESYSAQGKYWKGFDDERIPVIFLTSMYFPFSASEGQLSTTNVTFLDSI